LEIPEDREVAETYSRGEAMVEALPKYREAFRTLWYNIEKASDGMRATRRIAHANV
jgi:MinD superfamily P-loop ATPase